MSFEDHRPHLMAIAYGMLGSVAEAEDVVQDAYLRWHDADQAAVRSEEAFLTTVTTRLAIDRLRSARVRREEYVGPWLPEPLVRDTDHDPADLVAEAEQLSLALLVALERLNPVERAVLLLRDVFDLDYAEVAEAVERSPAACRQIAHRARERAGEPARGRRVQADEERRLVDAFMAAVATGDLEGLTGLLAADAILYSDGGGVVRAARLPIYTAPKIARFFLGIARKGPPGTVVDVASVNGGVGLRMVSPEGPVGVLAFDVAEGVITGVYVVVTPLKLERLGGARLG